MTPLTLKFGEFMDAGIKPRGEWPADWKYPGPLDGPQAAESPARWFGRSNEICEKIIYWELDNRRIFWDGAFITPAVHNWRAAWLRTIEVYCD